ncbi:TonB family protein [Mucilaginibacter rubeus]|uniref:TonB family protein n=1 Tax=Mucilaginibacter rubeus TaxID=2027860 RepID=A0A5C1HS53_9SPHI|nr:TonB family protein [Mucilaginibacter rubeus]QEM08499.1 TonB family protein [Mucilaginibacter rubeus]
MRSFFSLLLILAASRLFAQQTKKDSIVKRDTINIHGYVYDEAGKPVKYIELRSSQKYIDFDRVNITTRTDTSGHFTLEGVKFNDTLTVEENILYASTPIYNEGSRFLIIHLPFAALKDVNQKGQMIISAKRTRAKTVPSFIRKSSDDPYCPFIGLHLAPRYKSGNERFIQLVNQQVLYPAKAIENNIEGTVQIAFKVEKDGTLTGFKVLKGIGYGCEEELINAIKRLGGWIPGIDNGRPILMTQTVSVEFKLTDK